MTDAKYTKELTETLWPLITASNARGLAWHVRQGKPFGGISQEALAVHLEHSADTMEAQQKAIGGAHLDPSAVLVPAEDLAKAREALEEAYADAVFARDASIIPNQQKRHGERADRAREALHLLAQTQHQEKETT